MEPQALPPLPELTTRERDEIRSLQEGELLKLAEMAGISGGLEAALKYFTVDVALEQLAPSSVPSKWFEVSDFAAADATVKQFYRHYFEAARANGIHDYVGYATSQMMMDRVTSQLSELGLFTGPKPLVANLPKGGTSAAIYPSPDRDRAIMLYSSGLYLYMGDYCKVIAQMFQPLSPDIIKSDHDLLYSMGQYEDSFYGLGLRALTPQTAIEMGAALATTCIEDHAIRQERRQVGRESRFLSMMLNNYAQMFVFAHELGHQELGHLKNPNPTPEQSVADEIAADRYAVEAVCAVAANEKGSAALGYWGCMVALTSFEALNASLLLFDGRPTNAEWIDTYYPTMRARRTALQRAGQEFLDDDASRAAIFATNLTNKALHFLGERIDTELVAHKLVRGVVRPSVIWQAYLERCYGAKMPVSSKTGPTLASQ